MAGSSPYFGGDYFGQGDPSLNQLHAMLQASFYQSMPVDGSSIVVGAAGAVQAKIGPADEQIMMEMEGYLSDSLFVAVVSTADFTTPPAENQQVTAMNGDLFLIRKVEADPSSYRLTLKKVSI